MHTYEKLAPSASKGWYRVLGDLAGFLLMFKSDLRGDPFVLRESQGVSAAGGTSEHSLNIFWCFTNRNKEIQ